MPGPASTPNRPLELYRSPSATSSWLLSLLSRFLDALENNTMLDTTEYMTRGVVVTQIFQKMPLLEPFYTDFEKNFDAIVFRSVRRSISLAPPLIQTFAMRTNHS